MTVWKKYGLGITFVVMFLIAWALMTWTSWGYFLSQQHEHHEAADLFGSSGYIWQWAVDTFSNWQADFLGQGLAVVVGAYLIFRGSEQSRDSSDRVEGMVQDIEREVRGPEAAQTAQNVTRAQLTSGGIWRNYGLGYALLGAFAVSWILMTWTGWVHYSASQQEHGETATVFGSSGYIWEWMRETFMNWQSDLMGHGVLVLIPAYLLYKGSSQSREGLDRVEQAVGRIQQALHSRQEPGTTVRERRPRQMQKEQPKSFWKRYGLGIAFIGAFLATWVLMTWSSWGYFVSQQQEHHQIADVFGKSGYIWQWGVDTFSNWQADLLWDGIAVVLGAYLIFQGSEMSPDRDDRIEQLATSIERRIRGEGPAKQSQARTERELSRGGIWRNYGLAYTLIAAGLVSWALMTWMGWMHYAANQQEHGSAAELFGASGYIWAWGRWTLENWQADILGHTAMIILTAYLLYRGSAESRESEDQIELALRRIQDAVESKGKARQPQLERQQK